MLAEASRQNPSVNFNRQFPGSATVVVNNRDVSGAFTSGGWQFMQEALKNADKYFGGEEWVLGPQAKTSLDPAELERQLRGRYQADFLSEWREYLQTTAVVRYRSLSDAAQKLNTIAGNQSPLLASLWLASQNTAVEQEEAKQAFQPVQHVVPAENRDRYVSDANASYMNALAGLQASVEQAANTSGAGRDAAVNQVITQATNAKVVTRQVAQNFRIDPQGNVGGSVQSLLEAPILYAEALVRSLGPAELNAKGQALCAQFTALMRKYPFNPEATAEATLPEAAAILQPGTGALCAFYEGDLREYMVRQGDLFVANPTSQIRLTAEFVNFFNRAAAFANALYPGGATQPRLDYKVTLRPPAGMQSLSLAVDNGMLTAGRGGAASHAFEWPGGGAQQVRLIGRFGDSPELTFASYQGLWAVFRFFGDADRSTTTGGVTRLEWVPRQGRAGQPMTLPDGTPLTVQFDVESAAPVFQKGYLSGFGCVATVAR
jgi:type VI secretion system protein ImpL